MSRSWGAALAAAGLYLLAEWSLGGNTGLVRTVVTNTPNRSVLDTRQVDAIDFNGVNPAAGGPAGVIATWRGAWDVPDSGLYELFLESTGRSSWTIDDSLANEVLTPGGAAARTVWLAAGFHTIEISSDATAPVPNVSVTFTATGQPSARLDSGVLKPRLPRNPRLRAVTGALQYLVGWIAIAVLVLAIRKSAPTLLETWRRRVAGTRPVWLGRAASWTVLACILIHGALLRIDAITGRYGPVTSPQWLAAVQTRSIARPETIRPASISWELEPTFPHSDGTTTRYRSDPHVYIDAGRTMTSFYGAHFREPVFPFATRTFLRALDGQDVAVSFASTFFSLLAVWLTYLLGASLWSRPIGLLAALALSLDSDVISLASLGWRDDAYMAVVTLCAYLTLRWWRAGEAGPRVSRFRNWQVDSAYVQAAVVGVAAGLAILTRIMAVSFLAVGALYMVFARRMEWRRQLALVALAAVTAGVVAGPYFLNCWRVYGDPLYTFNVHGGIYSFAEGEGSWSGSTAGYVSRKFARRPFEMVDTVARGLTTYPFSNKFHGLNSWIVGLGQWASIAALAGLAVLAALPQGRLLLVLVVASLVPFSFTWTTDPDFRFTVHAYPFLLIAAAVGLGAGVRAVQALLVPGRIRLGFTRLRTKRLAWASAAVAAFAAVWFFSRVSPSLMFAESLRAQEDATVTAGARDVAFFTHGWSEPWRGKNVSMRIATEEGELWIRVPEEADYAATLRMDPFPRPLNASGPLPTVHVELNGAAVAVIPLQWTPGRVGSYDIVLPRAAVRRGANRLVLRPTQPGAIGLWYVRVRPPADLPIRTPARERP